MSPDPSDNPCRLPVTVIIGATSKWQAGGRNTLLVHGGAVGNDTPVGSRWGLGGALARRFAREGHHVVLTSRTPANLDGVAAAIKETGGSCSTIVLDVAAPESISAAFGWIRAHVGDPDVLIYNAGYMAGRELPPERDLLENFPTDLFEVAMATACRGPFLVAKEVLPCMRERGAGTILFSNNQYSLRGRKRSTGESLYYPRTMMRALAQALTEEYSVHGVHVANVVVDGFIDSPGTRALDQFQSHPERLIDPERIAEAYFYLHQQDRTCWSHELQLTAAATPVNH